MKTVTGDQTFVFQVPANLPCYGDWDFVVYPGEFELYASTMIETLTAHITHNRWHYLAMLIGAGWYRDHKQYLRLRKLLRGPFDREESALAEFQSTIWCLASCAIFSRRFASFYCPKCQQKYAPTDGVLEPWAFGEELAAHGGHRLECPKSHTVYSIMEWNS